MNLLSIVCKCVNKMTCACISFWRTPSRNCGIQATQRDLAEWKRIEGIDQYNKKRH